MKCLSDIENSSSPDIVDFEVNLDILMDFLEILELRANTALIRLIVKTLSDPFHSLKQLLHNLKKENIEKIVQSFESEMDRMFQIGSLAIACTHDIISK